MNHPPMHHWLTYAWVRLLGNTPAGLRAGPTLWCALSAALLAWIAGRAGGVVAGVSAALVFAAMPMAFLYGRMPSWSSFALFVGLVLTQLMGRASPSRGCLLAVGALTFVGASSSWLGVLMAPLLWLYDAALQRRRPDPRLGLLLAGATAAALAVYLSLAVWWAGAAWTFDTLRHIAGAVQEPAMGPLAFAATQGEHLTSLFGWPGAVLGAGGVLVAAFSRLRGGEIPAQLVFWTVLCLLHLAIAPVRAINHEFWWYAFLPVVVLATSAAASSLWHVPPAGRRVWARAGAVALVVLVVATGVQACLEGRAEEFQADDDTRLRDAVARLTGPGDFVVASIPPEPWMYEVDSWLVFGYLQPDLYLRDLELFRSGRFRTPRLVFLVASPLIESFRDDLGRDLVAELVAAGMVYTPPDPPQVPLAMFVAGG